MWRSYFLYLRYVFTSVVPDGITSWLLIGFGTSRIDSTLTIVKFNFWSKVIGDFFSFAFRKSSRTSVNLERKMTARFLSKVIRSIFMVTVELGAAFQVATWLFWDNVELSFGTVSFIMLFHLETSSSSVAASSFWREDYGMNFVDNFCCIYDMTLRFRSFTAYFLKLVQNLMRIFVPTFLLQAMKRDLRMDSVNATTTVRLFTATKIFEKCAMYTSAFGGPSQIN